MNPKYLLTLLFIFSILSFNQAQSADEQKKSKIEVSGEFKKWHKVTLTFDDPETDERHSFNPFLNYRLDVVFLNNFFKSTEKPIMRIGALKASLICGSPARR